MVEWYVFEIQCKKILNIASSIRYYHSFLSLIIANRCSLLLIVAHAALPFFYHLLSLTSDDSLRCHSCLSSLLMSLCCSLFHYHSPSLIITHDWSLLLTSDLLKLYHLMLLLLAHSLIIGHYEKHHHSSLIVAHCFTTDRIHYHSLSLIVVHSSPVAHK